MMEDREQGEKDLEENYSFPEEIEFLDCYEWPFDEEKRVKTLSIPRSDSPGEKVSENSNRRHHCYRKVTNFKICDVFGINLKPFFINEEDPANYFILAGQLIPFQEISNISYDSMKKVDSVKVLICEIFFNFGTEEAKMIRKNGFLENGYWIRDVDNHLYQILPPSQECYISLYETAIKIAERNFYPKNCFFGRNIHLLSNSSIFNDCYHFLENDDATTVADPISHFTEHPSSLLFLHGKLHFLDEDQDDGSLKMKEGSLQMINVQIAFSYYEISYGDKQMHELNHGLLIPNLSQAIWFKVANSQKQNAAMIQSLSLTESLLEGESNEILRNGCDRHHKYYSFPYRRMTSFFFQNYLGNFIEKSSFSSLNLSSEASSSSSLSPRLKNIEVLENSTNYYILSGLIKKKVKSQKQIGGKRKKSQQDEGLESEEEVTIRIRVFIKEAVLDMGYHIDDGISLFCLSVNNVYYRLVWSKECRFSSFSSLLNDYYNWPSDDESQVWRRITDYRVLDCKGNQQTFLTRNNDFILQGNLLPSPSSPVSSPSTAFSPLLSPTKLSSSSTSSSSSLSTSEEIGKLRMQIYIRGYSIDFGLSLEDENRGLWIQDNHNNWFKIIPPPAHGYETFSNNAFNLSNKFLKFHEILFYSKNPAFVRYDDSENEGLYLCDYTIQDIYKESKGSFDIDFIWQNRQFVIDNIDNVIHPQKAKAFFTSIRNLTSKCFPFFISCFL
jgi:hypothetical protein